MLSFCGMDKCSLDANGRLKLSPRLIDDFKARGSDLVMHCWPEGQIGLYPEDIYLEMRRSEPNPAARAAESMIFRSTMRQFGAWSQSERISAQGRITLPPLFRVHAGLDQCVEAVVVGVEIGVEIWSYERFIENQKQVQQFEMERGKVEIERDLGRIPSVPDQDRRGGVTK